MSNVFVSGAGIITCLGRGMDETYALMSRCQSGLSQLQFNGDTRVAAGVVPFTNDELAHHTGSSPDLPRAALLGIHAVKEAYLQSGIQNMHQWRCGLISACLYGGMDRTELFYQSFRENTASGRLRDVVHYSPGSISKLIAETVNAMDFVTTMATGSSSALNAMIMGYNMIRSNQLDVVFAGGTESLSQFAIHGLRSENLIDSLPCRPFDASCSGLNPGEGAAYVVLISDRVMANESAAVLSRFAGFGSDNYINNCYPSTLKEEAASQSISAAMAMASIKGRDVGYLNLFGTGLPDHDLVECVAVQRALGEIGGPMSSTKAYTGYTSGACGAVESVISLISISQQKVFASLGFETPIPEIGIQPLREFKAADVGHAMVNSFGRLGNCSSVVFSRPA